MVKHVVISICLIASTAHAEELGSIIQAQQAPAASSNPADPKDRQSDPNCQALANAASFSFG